MQPTKSSVPILPSLTSHLFVGSCDHPLDGWSEPPESPLVPAAARVPGAANTLVAGILPEPPCPFPCPCPCGCFLCFAACVFAVAFRSIAGASASGDVFLPSTVEAFRSTTTSARIYRASTAGYLAALPLQKKPYIGSSGISKGRLSRRKKGKAAAPLRWAYWDLQPRLSQRQQ
jgi:hypothetical protein